VLVQGRLSSDGSEHRCNPTEQLGMSKVLQMVQDSLEVILKDMERSVARMLQHWHVSRYPSCVGLERTEAMERYEMSAAWICDLTEPL
jgi:hypothetical protein